MTESMTEDDRYFVDLMDMASLIRNNDVRTLMKDLLTSYPNEYLKLAAVIRGKPLPTLLGG
jgi:hypothetical protein